MVEILTQTIPLPLPTGKQEPANDALSGNTSSRTLPSPLGPHAQLMVQKASSRAPRFVVVSTPREYSSYGGIECQNEQPVVVIYDQRFPPLTQCTREHETFHLNDILNADPNVCKGQANGTRVSAVNKMISNLTELPAYKVDKQCLDRIPPITLDTIAREQLTRQRSNSDYMIGEIEGEIKKLPNVNDPEKALRVLRKIFHLDQVHSVLGDSKK